MQTLQKKKQQLALSIPEQISNLKSLGLEIKDEKYASDFLNDVSYFRFIKAYSLGLKCKNARYAPGVTFEQLVALYLFNSNFRHLLFAQIERIEVNLRCRLSNYFSQKYGVLGYQDKRHFQNEAYYNDFLQDINQEISRNKRAPFIRNFLFNYEDGSIPFYALVEIFSFGTLSKFYKNMLSADKQAIAKEYGVPYPYLESWFESISYVRNLCAHYGRLYNAKLTKTPRLYSQYANIQKADKHIFGVICCMKHLLLNDSRWQSFISDLESLFHKYPDVQIFTMGFPVNWKEVLS